MDLTIHTTFPDNLQSEWNELLAESVTHVPFLRFEYLRSWWQHLGGGEWDVQSVGAIQRSPYCRPSLPPVRTGVWWALLRSSMQFMIPTLPCFYLVPLKYPIILT